MQKVQKLWHFGDNTFAFLTISEIIATRLKISLSAHRWRELLPCSYNKTITTRRSIYVQTEKQLTDELIKCCNQCKLPLNRNLSVNQVPKISYGRFTIRHRSLSSSDSANTAISPDVLFRTPKCTPLTSSSVSVELNCEYCVYFQHSVFMSYEYFRVEGYSEFHTCKIYKFADTIYGKLLHMHAIEQDHCTYNN